MEDERHNVYVYVLSSISIILLELRSVFVCIMSVKEDQTIYKVETAVAI